MTSERVTVHRVLRCAEMYLDSQSTMHDASVQLGRLGQTNGQPHRQHTGDTAEKSATTHESNIDVKTVRK